MKKVISMLILSAIYFCAFSQPKLRVEPSNWWIGMEHSTIQVLLYGENIGSLTADLDNEYVKLDKAISVENPNYLFLYLQISPEANEGTFPIKLSNGKKLIHTVEFQLLKREEGSAEITGFDPSDVMYLITPDRFANGDPGNDSVKGMREKGNRSLKEGRHGGDLKGIQDHLDYIIDMGFTAIWVNPIIENDMPTYSYHGYAATDFYQIDRRFGTNEEYQAFCKIAKARDIKIIMDMIMNHCGSEHWFAKDPPTSDWINFENNFVQTSHRRNTVQDIHASEYDKAMFSDGWFVRTMPDLNQKNQLMADYLIQNTLWWIEYSGISGIRMDTYPYPDKDFMTQWTCAIKTEYPNFNIVGEEWTTNQAIVSYWQEGKVNHDGYTSCLPSLMDFPMQDAVTRGLNGDDSKWDRGLINTYHMLTMDFLYPDPNNLVIFPDNHDMDRFFTQVNEDYDLFKMGMIYYATMRGVPQLYYGTEILMSNTGSPGDHMIIRTDFPGGWDGDAINGFTGEGLSDQQKEAKAFIKQLLNWRKDKEVIHTGKLTQFVPENGIYVYFRYNDSEKVMVILNKNDADTNLKLDRFKELTAGIKTAKNIVSGELISFDDSISVPKKSGLILELK